MKHERNMNTLPGVPMLFVSIGLYFLAGYLVYELIQRGIQTDSLDVPLLATDCVIWLAAGLMTAGFFIVEPNGSKVVLLFGRYVGTVKRAGFHWANPFMTKRGISLRVRTLAGERLKVNDLSGNPVEIAAVVVWQVVDTFKASFDVDNYEEFVPMQSEAAIRHTASLYPYDGDDETMSLRQHTDEVSANLQERLIERLERAGVDVIEARLTHLAYAPEIAGAMLRRQQAAAILAAREKIVEGAVGMVENAIERLQKQGVLSLDEERRAAMVSNLMVVLCSEQAAMPVLNTGTLYQ